MNKIYLLILFVFVRASLLAQEVDTKHIRLKINFDWTEKKASGSAEVSFSTLKESNQIFLDAGFLTIHKVTLNNKQLQYQYKNNDEAKNLKIILDKFYKPSESVAIKIEYSTNYENRSDPNSIGGSFGKGLRFFKPTSTTPNKRRQIWSSGEPEGNKYWFPCNEEIADVHTTEIFATVEKPLMAISNGKLVDIKDNRNSTRTFHYKSDVAFPNYLVSIVVGEYLNIKQQSNKTTINNYGYADEKEAITATVAPLPEFLKFLETKTGSAYPFETYSQAVVQDYPFPGLVGQHTAALLSDNYIDDYGVHQDFKYLWDGVAVQALANQWFGNLLMPQRWNDIWLNNAFAQYFAGLFTVKDNGNAEYLLWYYPFEKGAVNGDWYAGNKHPVVPEKINDLALFTTDSYSKYKGALVLRMLQKEMGDDNWWTAVRYYVKTNAGRQVSTKDFQDAIEKTSGKSFQWFFDQWIYKMGLPAFEISKSYNAHEKKLMVTVKQIEGKIDNATYPQVKFFQGKLLIEIDDKIHTVFLKPQKENTFVFAGNATPEFVNFNYEESYLCEATFEKTKEEYLAQLQNSKDVLARQEAGNQLILIANDSNTNATFKNKIREALINQIQSKQYWRHRMWALSSLPKLVGAPYDAEIISLLKTMIKTENSWLKSTAISILGKTTDTVFTGIYISALVNESDRVINSAAIAIGKTKSQKAFETLIQLEKQPSWKNQNRISALNGLQQLGDERAVKYVLSCIEDYHSPRWYLATTTWDYPFAAVNTLVGLGKGYLAYPVLFERFKKSLQDNDINDIFQNVQLIDFLKDERAKEVYDLLKEKFKTNTTVLEAVKNYENQYLENLKKIK